VIHFVTPGFLLLRSRNSSSIIHVRFMVNQSYMESSFLRTFHTVPEKSMYCTRLLPSLRCAMYLADTLTFQAVCWAYICNFVSTVKYFSKDIWQTWSHYTAIELNVVHCLRYISSLQNEFWPLVLSLRICSRISRKTEGDASALVTDPQGRGLCRH
jgi:hypothetical protein